MKTKTGINLINPRVVSELEVVHYGNDLYIPEMVKPIRNNFVKPFGGLWTSPVESEFGWKHWCIYNDFHETRLFKAFTLKFNPGARIALIDSKRDLSLFPKADNELARILPKWAFDFEAILPEVDAIWLTVNGEQETRFDMEVSFYGWDCESILIMNKDCVYETGIRIKDEATSSNSQARGIRI